MANTPPSLFSSVLLCLCSVRPWSWSWRRSGSSPSTSRCPRRGPTASSPRRLCQRTRSATVSATLFLTRRIVWSSCPTRKTTQATSTPRTSRCDTWPFYNTLVLWKWWRKHDNMNLKFNLYIEEENGINWGKKITHFFIKYRFICAAVCHMCTMQHKQNQRINLMHSALCESLLWSFSKQAMARRKGWKAAIEGCLGL